jgi:protein-tyrosine phosphatase
MAEAFLVRGLDRAGVPANVSSAGVNALVDSAPAPEVVEVMREHGLDVAWHRARQLVEPDVVASDLVIGLTLEHLREAVVMDPSRLQSGFTLKELVRRGSAAGSRPANVPLAEWFAALTDSREIDDLLGDSPADDFPDPIGMPIGAYRQAAGELAVLCNDVVRQLWPALFGGADRVPAPGSEPTRGIV